MTGIPAELFDQLPESVAVYTPEGLCLYLNPITESMFGLSRDQVVGRVLWEVMPDAKRHLVYDAFGRVASTGQAEYFHHFNAPWGRWFSNRIFLADGKIWVIVEDITEQRRAEMLLRRTEEVARFLARLSMELSSSLDYRVTLDRVVDLAVPALGDMCVVQVVEEQGVGVAYAHRDPARLAVLRDLLRDYPLEPGGPKAMDRVLATRQPRLVREVTAEGLARAAQDPEHLRLLTELRMCSLLMLPLVARDRAVGVLTLAADTPDREFSEDNLGLAEEAARRIALHVDNAILFRQAQLAIRRRDDFLSVASHELRTPLTTLQLHVTSLLRAVQLGQQDKLSPPRLLDRLRRADAQLDRLCGLINDLLDVSRISMGRLELDLTSMDLCELAAEVAARFQEQAARAGTVIELRLEEPVRGTWDRNRMDQVLTNLVSNAIKYGAGKPIELMVSLVQDHALVRVRDQGIGIAASDLTRIFEKFERATSARRISGIGLGLWIAREIVEAHGGQISVSSAPSEGSTFEVLLPLAPPANPT